MSSDQDPSAGDSSHPQYAWQRAKALFGDVVTLPLHERAGVLDARCGDDAQLRQFVETLLRASDALPAGNSESVQLGLGAALGRVVRQALPQIERGRRFGAFAVVEEIGRGGMGVVYLAERHDGTVVQRVALKLVPPDTLHGDASQQLARERRLLAALEHPNIARLIDAGEDASGIPYFAMEYVQGAPLTVHCDNLVLSLAERLRLFRQVCAAVQYAHANLIVHCDIKAGNILVTDGGLPKLLDFGIATTLDAARADGESGEQRFFSPQTAAPEQFLGQPSSMATDIYALGVLLCELCAGQRPFANTGDRAELRRRVLEEDPALPSRSAAQAFAQRCGGLALPALRRRLAGDIDAIVARALAKSPRERYASVEQLDADIARHLERRPVQARLGERGYRLRRYLQRNALAVIFAAAVSVFMIVLAGLLASFAASTARQNEQLAHERDQARQREQQAQFERARAQQVTDFVIGLFKDSTPRQARAPDISARELLARGGEKLRVSLGEQPQLKAAMLAAVSEAQFVMDNLDGAQSAAREAFALRSALRPHAPADLIESLNQLATLANRRGRYAEALALVDQAQALAQVKVVSIDPIPLLMTRATALGGLQQVREELAIRRDVLARLTGLHGVLDIRTQRAARRVSGVLNTLGFPAESEQVLQDHLPQQPGARVSDDPEYAETVISLARLARIQGDLPRAEKLAIEAVEIYRRIYGSQASETADAIISLAVITQIRGDYPRALLLFREVLAIQLANDGETPKTASAEYNLGLMLLTRMDKPAEAATHLQHSVDIGEKWFPAGHGSLAHSQLALGSALRELRRYDEAEAELRKALDAFLIIAAPRGLNVAITRGELACIALARGYAPALAQARATLAASLQVLDRHVKPTETNGIRMRNCAARYGVSAPAPSDAPDSKTSG